MSLAIRIIKSGPGSSVQDAGRFGFQDQGLSVGGAMDEYASKWANVLLNNAPDLPLIEITLGNFEVEILKPVRIAITGAHKSFAINGQQVPGWASYQLKTGDRLLLDWCSSGLRSYLAITGGFELESEFGSVSTVVRERIGGLDGGLLKEGDVLPNGKILHKHEALYSTPLDMIANYDVSIVVRVILGSQSHLFSPEALNTFFNSPYVISPKSDRMGIRLSGAIVDPPMAGILSEGVPFGAIQIPPDGQPIIMMKDRQTLGGYPKLGAILPIDAFRLSQLTAGKSIRFSSVSIEVAQNIMIAQYTFFKSTAVKFRLEKQRNH